MFRISLIVAAACLSTGCASIVSGQNQSVSVVTKNAGADVNGAKCQLSNDKGTWYTTTPGSVTVRRSYSELTLNCTLDGVEPGIVSIKSATKGMAFGNILFGGIIGAGVDISTGAAYDYPEVISVEMGKVMGTQPAKPEPAKQAEKKDQKDAKPVAVASTTEPAAEAKK